MPDRTAVERQTVADGTGVMAGAAESSECQDCNGLGYVHAWVDADGFDHYMTCLTCDGTGQTTLLSRESDVR